MDDIGRPSPQGQKPAWLRARLPAESPARAMSSAWALPCAAATLALVVFGGAAWSASSTENDIRERAERGLRVAGLPDSGITVSGRDIVVSTPLTASERQRAQKVLEGTRGVAQVNFASSSLQPATGSARTVGSPAGTSVNRSPGSAPKVSVRFARGSAQLDDNAKRNVTKIASYLFANPGVRVELVGQATDEGLSDDKTLELASQRSRAVADAVVGAGVDASRVFPAVTTVSQVENPEVASLLRRVDTVFQEG